MTAEFYVCLGTTWVALLYACWHIGELRGRLDCHREVLRKIVEEINGRTLCDGDVDREDEA